jgi:hypothetical protein
MNKKLMAPFKSYINNKNITKNEKTKPMPPSPL